jgi:3-oxoacyl-[acyl-carrier-protein] synthase II
VFALQAVKDADWFPEKQQDKERTGVAIGAGMSCTYEMGMSGALVLSGKIRRLSPFFVPRILVNAAAGAVSMDYGFQGPNHAVSTACATGAHAIGDAFRMIQRGDADVMLAGGTESCVDAISLGGFSRLKALSTSHNDSPDRASRPFDASRDGFVLSEGAAVLVLEEAEHALARRAPYIYCEIMGYGMSGDAFHVTQPRSDGFGAKLAMTRALDGAGLAPSNISYINAHATSTLLGDKAELAAIDSLFNSSEREMPLYISSVKGALGHLLGAAGAVEAAISALTCYHHVAPPTANLVRTDIETKSSLIQESPRIFERKKLAVLSNSFGFGGTNTSLVLAGARIN